MAELAGETDEQSNDGVKKTDHSTNANKAKIEKKNVDSEFERMTGDVTFVKSNSEDALEEKKEEEKKTTEKDGEKEEISKDQNVIKVLIEATCFNVTIVYPGMEKLELQVSSMEFVHEIHHVLIDKKETCHRTCFSLQLDGRTLDNCAELKAIEGLKEGSVIKVVEEPYTIREARIHMQHIHNLLRSVDPADAFAGMDCNSLSYLNIITAGDILEKKVSSKSDTLAYTPPDYIMPGCKERPLLPLHPNIKELKTPPCIKVLTLSGWNPPPGNRKMHGDLMYLYAVTLEDKKYHITASSRGFFVNQCTEEVFNLKAAAQKFLSHTLVELLNQLSPSFKRNFAMLLKKRAKKHLFEKIPTPFQTYTWMVPAPKHTMDYIHTEDEFSTRLGYDIPGQTRDWNKEIQTTRELSRKTLPERLIRERAIFTVHCDFVAAATRGAKSVIDGNVMAVNPGDDAKMQMFIWNNIFFSLGFDVHNHYKEFGGDYAAYAALGYDLQGVKAYFNTDIEGMYILGTVVVDYRGFRVMAQSIIPGILEKEQEQSVVYGSIDFGKTVVTNDKYKELLKKSAAQLKIRPHKVLNNKGEEIELFSSIECKGIFGSDQRHYVLDLLRTFPPDVNYSNVDKEELSNDMKSHGYPHKHRHSLSCLRQELINEFEQNRYVAFIRNAAYHFRQLQQQKKSPNQDIAGLKKIVADKKDVDKSVKSATNIEMDEAKKIVDALTCGDSQTFEESSKEIVKKAAQEVASLSDTEFNITFNPDVFQTYVKHANPESTSFQREKQVVKDAAEFLVLHQIPTLVNTFLDHSSSPIDGLSLAEAMHIQGINMRYLGKVAETIAKYKSVSYVYTISIMELIKRAAKHLFKSHMQGIDMMSISAAISHFLNCFIGSFSMPYAAMNSEELQGKNTRKRNKRRNKGIAINIDNTDWVNETPKSLWKKIVDEVDDYFHYTLECDSVDSAYERYSVQQVSLLRSFCQHVGIQILLREYNLDARNKAPFSEDDIVNVFPIVKHVQPEATDAYNILKNGQSKIKQGLLKDGYNLICDALYLLNNVYGAMHIDMVSCHRLLARLNYIMGDYGEAMSYQQRAVLMSERVLGIDHPNTITEYTHLALYCFANNQVSSALRLMYRTRYLGLLCHGENHPEIGLIDSNIGLILHAVEEYKLSLRFLEHALQVNRTFYGAESLKVAMSYHLVARTHSCQGDFRAALSSEKDSYTIYRQMLGEDHDHTKESSDCLKHLTQQAVTFQKKMNEIVKGDKVMNLVPLQIQTPSLHNMLEILNVINGIVFVQISPEEIELLRQEIKKREAKPKKNEAEETKNSDISVVI